MSRPSTTWSGDYARRLPAGFAVVQVLLASTCSSGSGLTHDASRSRLRSKSDAKLWAEGTPVARSGALSVMHR